MSSPRTPPRPEAPWTIGRLARLAGVPVSTIRYYERSGLLPRPARSPSGYRLYDERDLERLTFIRSAQSVGFSLDDIRELLRLDERDSCRRVRGILSRRLDEVERRLREITALRDTLCNALKRCQRARRGCPVLRTLRKPHRRRSPRP